MNVRRKRIWGWSIAVLACLVSTGSEATAIFLDGFEDAPTFSAAPPPQSVAAGVEEARCYYFRAPATAQAVRRISSVAGAGVANLVVYATYNGSWVPQEVQPPGTVDTTCDQGFEGWLHVARAAPAETILPTDDGDGRRVAFQLAANQPLVLRVLLLNETDQPLQTQVDLTFETWNPELETTATASYVTDNINLSIPPNATDTESAACAVPPSVKFWRFTARTHKQGTRMRLLDGATTILDGTDWENPPVMEYGPPAFYTFTSPLTYECTYFNPTNRTITRGDSEATDEVCQGIGWFFPATKPAICVGNIGPL